MQSTNSRSQSQRYLQLLLVVAAIVVCLFVIRSAVVFGFSRVLATYSLTVRNSGASKKAVELAPNDPEAHFANAVVLGMSDTPKQSVTELEQAVALRPADYTLWQQLGLLRDQMGDTAAALAAFDEAVKRAPFYSQPRWNRGNVLLRSGQYEAAFVDLNQAAQSNPDLIPTLLDLAWGISRGDVNLTEQLAQIKSDKMRIAFAKVLARRGKAAEALAQLSKAGNVPDTVKRELLDQLLANGAFKEAYEVWQSAQPQATKAPAGAAIYDGGFEGSLSFAEGGFGWRVPRDSQATSIVLDSSQPQSGAKNLRIEFNGNSNPGSLVSQLILVEPSRRYKINFFSRSQDVVTGGPPFVLVSDASGYKPLGRSSPLAKGTSDWQLFSFEFTTSPATTAVVLGLQRDSCTTSPCPIFGSVSLDSFSVEQAP